MTHDDRPDSAVNACGAAGESECARRSVLRGALALGAVGLGGALTGCGGSSSSDAAPVSAQGSTPVTGTRAAAATKAVAPAPVAAPPAAPRGAKKVPLGPASAVTVGGGVIYEAAAVLVTQPTAGVYKAFDANCTHQKCLLADISGGTIFCACHGAKFSAADGSVIRGPATLPLTPRTVTVTGGKVYVT